jgi:hypothetical protein
MGAICRHCKQDMLVADGCSFNKLQIKSGRKKTLVDRCTEMRCHEDEQCHDCGAKVGHVHHFGCDNETCPLCGDQLAFCKCKFVAFVIGK